MRFEQNSNERHVDEIEMPRSRSICDDMHPPPK
jgi:hypothetical protein